MNTWREYSNSSNQLQIKNTQGKHLVLSYFFIFPPNLSRSKRSLFFEANYWVESHAHMKYIKRNYDAMVWKIKCYKCNIYL